MNGDDTFSWAKKPALPDNRKRAVSKKTIDRRLPSRLCQKCALQGIVSPIHLFQLNEEEALLMCKNVDCTFMPSSNWESLVVKRDISKVTYPGIKRTSSLASTTFPRDSHNKQSKPVLRSSRSVPVLSLSSSVIKTLPQQSVTVPVQRFLISPPCPPDLSLKGKERKTLVPIAPFLDGHAHSFSSFQTNKIEHTFQQRGSFVQCSATSATSLNPSQPKRIVAPNKKNGFENCAYLPVGSKRSACSLDSDSLSSNSSSADSRPTTPVSVTFPCQKRIKRVVLPPETLSKLLTGAWKLEIRKSNKTEVNDNRSVSNTNSAYTISTDSVAESSACENISKDSAQSTRGDLESDIPSSKKVSIVPGSGDLEIKPIGALHDIVQSGGTGIPLSCISGSSESSKSHIEAINFLYSSNSIKSHIETINQHINAINTAVGLKDFCRPLDFSNLCQKINGTATTETLDETQVCHEDRWMSSADFRSDPDNSDTNSSQSTFSDLFVPIGQLETPIAVSPDISSNLHSKDFDQQLGCTFHTSELFDGTVFKNSLKENFEGRF